jgi:hypothetical protein
MVARMALGVSIFLEWEKPSHETDAAHFSQPSFSQASSSQPSFSQPSFSQPSFSQASFRQPGPRQSPCHAHPTGRRDAPMARPWERDAVLASVIPSALGSAAPAAPHRIQRQPHHHPASPTSRGRDLGSSESLSVAPDAPRAVARGTPDGAFDPCGPVSVLVPVRVPVRVPSLVPVRALARAVARTLGKPACGQPELALLRRGNSARPAGRGERANGQPVS